MRTSDLTQISFPHIVDKFMFYLLNTLWRKCSSKIWTWRTTRSAI